MDTTKAARYKEIISSFTLEELRRLPLGLEYCSSLEDFLASTDPTVAVEISTDTFTALSKELECLMERELQVLNAGREGIFSKWFHRAQETALLRLAEEREAVFEKLIQEHFFLSAGSELSRLIYSARSEHFLANLSTEDGYHATELGLENKLTSILALKAAFSAQLTLKFTLMERRYEKHLFDVNSFQRHRSIMARI